jgi:conjugative relaxase-like TrwC/TraI family protein
VLTISQPKKAGTAARYYLSYYLQDANGQAIWHGRGALFFDVTGEIDRKEFCNLLNGFDREGKVGLLKNAGDKDRQAFWDLTFSVPKSVSVAYVAASKHVQKEIDAAIFSAVCSTLDRIELKFGLSRKGAGGKEWVPAVLTFALFRHLDSREGQPQIHWHCLLFNLGVRQDLTIGTLQTKPIFDAKLSLGHYFRHELAGELKARLGFTIEHEIHGFHIQGVPKELCEANSARRHQIKDYMANHGLAGGKAAKLAAVETRAPKKHTSQKALLSKWRMETELAGWNEAKVESLVRGSLAKTENPHSPAPNKSLPELSKNRRDSPDEKLSTIIYDEWLRSKKDELTQTLRSKGRQNRQTAVICPLHRRPQSNKESLKAFSHELREATDRIFPEKQTRERLERVAFAIGRKYGVRADMIAAAVDDLKLPTQRSLYRTEWRPLFPYAPRWSPVRDLRTPRIVLRNKARKWGKIYYSKQIPRIGGATLEFRIQERRIFAKAPAWSPASKLHFKALRFAPVRPFAEAERLKMKLRERKQKTLHH